MLRKHRKEAKRQILLLDNNGNLIAACDTLFDTKNLLGTPILPLFPLIESIFPVIRKLQLSDPEIRFKKVKTVFPKLPGIYDYAFVKMKSLTGTLILWIIQDHTEDYEAELTLQQIENEMAIARELLGKL